jgi:hypothetical protein
MVDPGGSDLMLIEAAGRVEIGAVLPGLILLVRMMVDADRVARMRAPERLDLRLA